MAGFFDSDQPGGSMFNIQDPNSMMLMGALAGLGQAGAASRMPVTPAQVWGGLGGGLLAGQQASQKSQLMQEQTGSEALKNAMLLNQLGIQAGALGVPAPTMRDIKTGKFSGFPWGQMFQENGGSPSQSQNVQMPMPTGTPQQSPALPSNAGVGGGSGTSGAMQGLTLKAAQANNIDPEFAIAHIKGESDFNPLAVGPSITGNSLHPGKPQLPPKGIAQLADDTAAQWKVDPFNPEQSLNNAWGPMLRGLLDKNNGDYVKAAQAYGTIPHDLSKMDGNQKTVYEAAVAANQRAQPQIQLAQNTQSNIQSDAGPSIAPQNTQQPASSAAAMPNMRQLFLNAKFKEALGYQLTPLDQAAMAWATAPSAMKPLYMAQVQKTAGLTPQFDLRQGGTSWQLGPDGQPHMVAQSPAIPMGSSLQPVPGGGYAALPVHGAQEIAAGMKGAEAGATAGATQPFTQANEAFKAQVGAAEAGNRPITLHPGETTNINPQRVPYPAPIGQGPIGPNAMLSPQGTATQVPGAPITLQGMSPAEFKEQEAQGTKAGDMRQTNIDAANAAQQQQATLQTLKNEAPNFYTGPFANHVQQAQSFLRLVGMANPETVASYEDFVKNAGTLTRQAVKDTSPRAAVQEFKLINSALPNPEMSPMGLKRVINEYMGLNDYRVAKAQAQSQWSQTHNNSVNGFETDWQGRVTPYAFIAARMEPDDLIGMLHSVRTQTGGLDEISRLKAQMNYIKQTGLDQYR